MAINIKNTKKKPSPDIQSLQSDAQCWHKIKILLFDLRNLDERMDSKARLDLVTDRSYISAPYFTPSEIKAIKSFVPDGGESTLEQLILSALETKLERRKKKQLANGDYRVCASHDLAPVFEKAFGVRPKDLAKDKKFVKALTKDGLDANNSHDNADTAACNTNAAGTTTSLSQPNDDRSEMTACLTYEVAKKQQ